MPGPLQRLTPGRGEGERDAVTGRVLTCSNAELVRRLIPQESAPSQLTTFCIFIRLYSKLRAKFVAVIRRSNSHVQRSDSKLAVVHLTSDAPRLTPPRVPRPVTLAMPCATCFPTPRIPSEPGVHTKLRFPTPLMPSEPGVHYPQLRVVLLAAAAAAAVVVVRLSSQAASPAEALGWGRDAFGMYNYGAPRAQQQVSWFASVCPAWLGRVPTPLFAARNASFALR